MRARPVPRNFISGELAPWLDGIMNDLTRQGARTLENVLVKKRGALTQRPGTYFIAETKDSTKASVLVPVSIDDDNHYVLEIGDAYIRFYKNHQRITYSGTTTIYEVTSPWSAGDVSKISRVYNTKDKTIYFACKNASLRALVNTSDAGWAINPSPLLQVPPPVIVTLYGYLYRSDDAKRWVTERPKITGRNYIAIAAGDNSYTIMSQSGIFRSDITFDSWVSVDSDIVANAWDLRANYLGEFVQCGDNMRYSLDDGVTWKNSLTTSGILDAAYDEGTGNWMVVGNAKRNYGSDLASLTSITEASYLYCVGCANDTWVAAGLNAIKYASSVAGPFVSQTITATFRAVAPGYPNGTLLWCVVASTGSTSGVIYTSPTGTVWTSRATTNSGVLEDVRWIGNKYIAVGGPSLSATLYYESFDGITWTRYTDWPITDSPLRSIGYRRNKNISDINMSGYYPAVIAIHENRLQLVQQHDMATIIGSKTGQYQNLFVNEYSDSAYSYRLASERNVDIQWMVGGLGGLVVGTRTAEGVMLGSPSEGITPNTAQFRWLSTFGSDSVQPVRVGNMVVFVQRGGEIVRGYIPNENAFQSPELTEYADHVTKGGVREIDHQEDPQNIVYFVRNDGQLLALTMDQGVRAWSRYVTDGTVESVAVIPTSGVEDEVWAIVNRTIGGSANRYVECFAPIATGSAAGAHYVDCGVNTTSAVTFASVGGMTHLAGEIVDALIDGTRVVGGLTVSVSGMIYVSPYSGTNIHAGLPYSATIQTMRGDYGSPYGDGTGFNKRTSEILVWVHDSMAVANFGPTPSQISEAIQYSSSTTLNTEVARINFPGTWDRDGYIWCVVRDPRPFTMVALSTDNETGDR